MENSRFNGILPKNIHVRTKVLFFQKNYAPYFQTKIPKAFLIQRAHNRNVGQIT